MVTTLKGLSAGESLLLVDDLMRAAFNIARDKRSDAYKLGARELLKHRAAGIRFVSPFPMGTAEADAFFAGSDEGRMIWTKHLATQAQATAAEVA